MGLGDALRGLFSRRDAPVEPLVLLPGEAEIARAVGVWRSGTLASVDGHLVLTTQRLVFATDAEDEAVVVLTWTLTGPAPDRLVAVEVGADASLTAPPSLVLVDSADRRVDIGILATRLTPNLSGANPVARDRMVATVRSALAVRREPPRHAHHRPAQPQRTQPRPGQPPASEPEGFSWFANEQ